MTTLQHILNMRQRHYLFAKGVQQTPLLLRTIVIAQLSNVPGDVMWDVGAGSGSIAIEWKLLRPHSQVYAIEQHGARCRYIRKNAKMHGADIHVINKRLDVPLTQDLPTPNLIFLGCPGESEDDLCGPLWDRLDVGGWIVSNAVSDIGIKRVEAAMEKYGGTTATIYGLDLPRRQWIAQKR